MIAEIVPDAYDAFGRKVLRPDLRRKGIHPTFPMGRYVSQPLAVKCDSIQEVRKFLSQCKRVTDMEQFGRVDYWQPPEDFEQTMKGDCDDFALWTWRQFLALGYDARFVAGSNGRYGIGHAWVEFFKDGKCYLVEPQMSGVGEQLPRLTTFRYRPTISVAWNGAKISFYAHQHRKYDPRFGQMIALACEWLVFWGSFWLRALPRLPKVFDRWLRRWLANRDIPASPHS